MNFEDDEHSRIVQELYQRLCSQQEHIGVDITELLLDHLNELYEE